MLFFKKYLKNQWCVGCVLIVVTVIFVAILNLLGLFKNLELKSYDLRMRLRGSIPVEESGIVLVTIDDQTFASLKKKVAFPAILFCAGFQ